MMPEGCKSSRCSICKMAFSKMTIIPIKYTFKSKKISAKQKREYKEWKKKQKDTVEMIQEIDDEDDDFDTKYYKILRKYANDTTPTSKMNALIRELRNIEEKYDGDKTLIFSNYKGTFKIISKRLNEENIKYLPFISGMGRAKRKGILDSFRDKDKRYNVLLISTKCASVGLNLQCANHIIFVDPKCNLGLENQAIGRCWRFGQQKTVFVTKLITKNTVEERIVSLMQDKDENEEKGMLNLKRKAKLTPKNYNYILGIQNQVKRKSTKKRVVKQRERSNKLNRNTTKRPIRECVRRRRDKRILDLSSDADEDSA